MINQSKVFRWRLILLICITLITLATYLTIHTYGNWEFALLLRGKKVLAFILVAIALSTSTITFQTLSHNQLLTPGVLGMDQIYIFFQTLFFFIFGGVFALQQQTLFVFLSQLLIMCLFCVILFSFFMNKTTNNLYLLLMTGVISSTFFSSISTFLQVIMDPNEYDLLQGKLFASFANVQTNHLLIGAILVILSSLVQFYFAPELDILHLGNVQATSLGINPLFTQRLLLSSVALSTGVATALVGPTIFLGFIISTLAYQLYAGYQHKWLFIFGIFVGVFALVGGQLLVEYVFQLKTTISTVIQFVGGCFFITKILMERNWR